MVLKGEMGKFVNVIRATNGSQEITLTNADGHTVLQIQTVMALRMVMEAAHAIMAIFGVQKAKTVNLTVVQF